MRRSVWLGSVLVFGVLVHGACGDGSESDPDGGGALATPDGGGDPDVWPDGGPGVELPTNGDGWTFFGPAQGGPRHVFGASFDEGGNLWVAGGEEGLFVLRAGASSFQRFTMADGLRPYGWMADGSEPPGEKYLKVISVSGAWAGTAFVGYAGRPAPAGELGCEDNWDGPNPDPSIYKSGDADKVTLDGDGIRVVHYDIFSGPGIVGGELRGREKICSVLRIRYDAANRRVWFGGNHAFAMGLVDYEGPASCNWAATPIAPVPPAKTDPFNDDYGHLGCNGVMEHVHPAVNGYKDDAGTQCCAFLTGGYYGVALDPVSKDVWFAGQMRTTKFKFASTGGSFYAAQGLTENPGEVHNRIDIWPDAVGEPAFPRPMDRVDDFASGAAALPDGGLWVSSFRHGLARLDASGNVVARVRQSDGLVIDKLGSVAWDPRDGSLWAGANAAGGISRLKDGRFTTYAVPTLGMDLTNQGVPDIQSFGSGATRKMVVSFGGNEKRAGAVGVYEGE